MSIASMIARANQTGHFQRPTKVASAGGARLADTWQDLAVDVPCWLQPASAGLIAQYEARSMRVTHRLYMETDPGVREGDRATVAGRTYLVRGVLDQAGLARLYRFDVEEHRP